MDSGAGVLLPEEGRRVTMQCYHVHASFISRLTRVKPNCHVHFGGGSCGSSPLYSATQPQHLEQYCQSLQPLTSTTPKGQKGGQTAANECFLRFKSLKKSDYHQCHRNTQGNDPNFHDVLVKCVSAGAGWLKDMAPSFSCHMFPAPDKWGEERGMSGV